MHCITSSSIYILLITCALSRADKIPCPYLQQQQQQLRQKESRKLGFNSRGGDGGIPEGGFDAVKQDIIDMVLTNSQDFFPADWAEIGRPNYGPFMIRLAWHCSGSYRNTDGRGGCDGGRIRFNPEAHWEDNGNLNHALRLLEPIKEKYGSDLSWGDLIILAGNAAIESMGGPVLGFCGGRIDDADGSESLILGPSEEQEALSPCPPSQQGVCNYIDGSPLGPTTVELIYVNPAGPKGKKGDPLAAAHDIRYTFGRMGFNDTETVSLVGGGHAFGKTHGACADPPCGDGVGLNTFTSGFEGAWTTYPTTWTNQYFNNLFDYTWKLTTGPGGNIQWYPNGTSKDIMMLTSDIAFATEDNYKSISRTYASDIGVLEHDFMHVWYRLTTQDMGPRSRCIGDNVPPPQLFQQSLPSKKSETSQERTDYIDVRSKIQELIETDPENPASFVRLAYQCASTYRHTDYRGGCNGARIRFPPESEWEVNQGTAETLATLSEVKEMFPDVSISDIIVLAGQTALEDAGFNPMKFCGGRVDADDAHGSEILAPREYDSPLITLTDNFEVMGLTRREGVALLARNFLSNQLFRDLSTSSDTDFTDQNRTWFGPSTTDEEAVLLSEPDLKAIAEEYAENESIFYDVFAKAWTKLMIADRFDGPFDNECTDVDEVTLPEKNICSIENEPSKECGSKRGKESCCSGLVCHVYQFWRCVEEENKECAGPGTLAKQCGSKWNNAAPACCPGLTCDDKFCV